MLRISPRLGGFCSTLVVAVASAVGAAPASATVTHSAITAPASGYLQGNFDSPDPQVIHVTGTSDGNSSTDNDHVDIICIASSSSDITLAGGVPVADDGTFTTDASYPSANRSGSCVLRAVPSGTGYNANIANFTGPHINYGQFQSQSNGTSTIDYDLFTSQFNQENWFQSAGDGGISDSAMNFQGRGFLDAVSCCGPGAWRNGPWWGNAYLDSVDNELYRSSQTVVDGHNAYLPAGADNINGGAPGAPVATVSQQLNPATGDVTVTETDGLAYCANADESINDSYAPSCDHWLPAPITLARSYVQNHDGLQTTMTDRWQSTDGVSHPVRLQYSENSHYCYVTMPGQTRDNDCHAAPGDEVSLPATAPATIYLSNYPDEPTDFDQTGGLTYMDKPDRIVFNNAPGCCPNGSSFVRVYNRTVPATGALTEQTVYSSGYTKAEAAQLAQAAQGATSSPAVRITSPANNAVVSSSSVGVAGTASDDVAVASLKVNGVPVSLNPDGTWSTTVNGLNPGANTITATATDGGGNATSVSETVIYSPAGAACTVPKVGRKTLAAAEQAITAARCTVGRITRATSNRVRKGRVLSQGAKGGSTVPAFYPVNLVVSSGRQGTAHLAHRTVSVRHGRVKLEVVCPRADGNPCTGTMSLRTLSGRHMTLGTGPHAFQTPAGKKRAVIFTVTRGQAAVLHANGVTKGRVYIITRNVAGKAAYSQINVRIKG